MGIQTMKFDDTRFIEREKPIGKEQGLIMPGGFWVTKQTYQAAWNQVHQNWQSIDWSLKQCAETLIGREYWKQQKNGGPRLAMGRCIKFFITHDMLPRPLENANPGKKGKRFYRPT
jgi:hypothetical protein